MYTMLIPLLYENNFELNHPVLGFLNGLCFYFITPKKIIAAPGLACMYLMPPYTYWLLFSSSRNQLAQTELW